jgi:RNA exonuclease 4
VTDARATMAVYRLHRKEWDKGFRQSENEGGKKGSKRKREGKGDEEGDGEFPGGGRRGVSSGLGTVVTSRVSLGSGGGGGEKTKWWKELGVSKGSMRVSKT